MYGAEGRDIPSKVLWLQPSLRRFTPNLQEVQLFVSVRLLAVHDAGTCRGHLQVTSLQHFAVAH